MSGSSILAIAVLLLGWLLTVITLWSEKKEQREINPKFIRKRRKLLILGITSVTSVVGVWQLYRPDREARDTNKKLSNALEDIRIKSVELDEKAVELDDKTDLNTQLAKQNGILQKHDTEAVQATININSYINLLKKHQILRREVERLLSKSDVDVYVYTNNELTMPDVNVRQELTYAHPTPERVAEINALVNKTKARNHR